jgi:hypothetical protein
MTPAAAARTAGRGRAPPGAPRRQAGAISTGDAQVIATTTDQLVEPDVRRHDA